MEFELHRVFYVAKQKESVFQREEQADPEVGSGQQGFTSCLSWEFIWFPPPIFSSSYHPLDLSWFLPFSLFSQVCVGHFSQGHLSKTHLGAKTTM